MRTMFFLTHKYAIFIIISSKIKNGVFHLVFFRMEFCWVFFFIENITLFSRVARWIATFFSVSVNFKNLIGSLVIYFDMFINFVKNLIDWIPEFQWPVRMLDAPVWFFHQSKCLVQNEPMKYGKKPHWYKW